MSDLNILLVEDNEDHALMIKSVLSGGSQVIHVTTGALAKNQLHNATANINIILLDINLPDCRGVELLRWIKSDSCTSLLPVVMLTTSGNPKDIVECYAAGASGFITKPVDFSSLKAKMEIFIKYWKLVSVSPVQKI